MRAAMIQCAVTHDKAENIRRAVDLIEKAAAEGIDMAVLPEMFCCPYANRYFREYGEETGGEAYKAVSGAAKKLGIYIVAGSVPEIEGDKTYNTSYVFNRQGRQIARHRKVHLFNINVPGKKVFYESKTLSPGTETTVFDTEFGKMGLCICFDLRFQTMSKEMADNGAKVIIAPAAFNMITGPAHWELLIRQRAVDNQIFTMAVAPARDVNSKEYVSYANSMAADPWGTVIAHMGEDEGYAIADMDFARIDEVRGQLPVVCPVEYPGT